jgi:hypothetical protein
MAAIGNALLWGVETAINAVIAAVGALLAVVVALLPHMPAAPSLGSATWLGWLNWLLPIGPMLAIAAAMIAAWVLFLAVRVALRWVKAL